MNFGSLTHFLLAEWPWLIPLTLFLIGFGYWALVHFDIIRGQLPKIFLVPITLIVGHMVTLITFFKPKQTVQYPLKRTDAAVYYRGRHYLVVEEDGRIRCDACTLCARICPTSVIDVAGIGKGEEKRPRKYTLNLVACLFCGMCVDICPEDAIKMVRQYELAQPFRNDAYEHEGDQPLVLTLPEMMILAGAIYPDDRPRDKAREEEERKAREKAAREAAKAVTSAHQGATPS
ncbi:MAG: NuoI/complex I 23 kDa subunit family protein [bacterium JZ-2024 1]